MKISSSHPIAAVQGPTCPTLLALRGLATFKVNQTFRSLLDQDIDRFPASLQDLRQTTDEVHMVC